MDRDEGSRWGIGRGLVHPSGSLPYVVIYPQFWKAFGLFRENRLLKMGSDLLLCPQSQSNDCQQMLVQ